MEEQGLHSQRTAWITDLEVKKQAKPLETRQHQPRTNRSKHYCKFCGSFQKPALTSL